VVLWISRLFVAVECLVCRRGDADLDVSHASLATMETFSFYWAGLILLRNIGLAIAVYGAWHMWLYVWRKQGTSFKYNRQRPKKDSSAFTFKNQTYDNMFHTLVSGVPIWTAYEVCFFYGPTRTILLL
jgi:sterol desaturase/sphingolipid hydroxylase (fatty acid hydroxylase superfamily)